MNIVPSEFSIEIAQALVDSNEQFPIALDAAWQWLGYSKKDKALDTLRNNFTLGIDYSLLQRGEWSPDGRSSDLYGLTIDCFKMMGMLARTDQGKRVREYFIECERRAKDNPVNKLTTLDALAVAVQMLQSQEKRIADQENAIKLQSMMFEQQQRQLEEQDIRLTYTEQQMKMLGAVRGYTTIAGFGVQNGVKIAVNDARAIARIAKGLCEEKGLQTSHVPDERWGRVNSYPIEVLELAVEQFNGTENNR